MKKYRISKYKPWLRDEQGRYVVNEWTSFSDIGKSYNDKIFGADEYEYAENKYIQVLMMILKVNRIDKLIIKDLERYFSITEIEKLQNRSKVSLAESEKELLQSINDGSEISVNDIEEIEL